MYKEFSRWGLALVLIVGLLLRVGFVVYKWEDIAPGGVIKDPDDYGRLALNLLKSGTFGFPKESTPETETARDSSQQDSGQSSPPEMRATAYRPPVYPALLTIAALPDLAKGIAPAKAQLNAMVVVGLHILLGLVTIGLVYYIGWRLEMRWSWLPALAVAADPIQLHFSGEMMTETLITMLAVWAWALYLMLVRPNMGEVGRKVWGMQMSLRVALMLGCVLGISVLTRPTMLPWAILMIFSLTLRGSDAGNRVSMITAALIVMSIINAGWMIRNKQQFGKPIWTTTHGGYTLLLANNPPLYEHFQKSGPDRNWDADSFHKLWAMRRSADPRKLEFWQAEVPSGTVPEPDIDELKDDRLAQETAIETIKAHPDTFAMSCLYRAGWLWSVFPNVDAQHERERLIIAGWYGFWFVMAGIGVIWMRSAFTSRVWFMPLLLVLTLTAIHMVYWSNMRMRAPMMPVVYMLACWPFIRLKPNHR